MSDQPCGVPELVTLQEAARLLSCSWRTIQNMIADGRLEKVKLGDKPQSPARVTMASIRALPKSTGGGDQAADD